MHKNSQLSRLMGEDLPGRTYQKRLNFRTNHREVLELYNIINDEIFDNQLIVPEIQIMSRCRSYWGICMAKGIYPNYETRKSNCIIRLSDKWFCKQWMITTLAHEMCHQYQWDIDGCNRIKDGKEPLMSHGPSFFAFRNVLAEHGISLKRSHGMKRWFKHQCFSKC